MVHLVLIGGGHSHAIALKMWGKKKVAGVKVTLISNVKLTPYSGMLPAYVAGYYSQAQTHIDLEKLAQYAEVDLIIDQVVDIDPQAKQIYCQTKKIVNFDVLAIDIGSTPKQTEIKNAHIYTIPAKPVFLFLEKWQQIIEFCQREKPKKLTLSIIGGGAGGVELALNMHQRLINVIDPSQLTLNLINRHSEILANHNPRARKILTKILKDKNVNLFLNTTVQEAAQAQRSLITTTGRRIDSDYNFLVTQADSPEWLKNNQIETDQLGFILVKDTLQSLNFDYIFATGDIATMVNYTRPKAGVFAVRQGKPLSENLCRYLSDRQLKIYRPQSKYLSIIGTGSQDAVAIWGQFACHSKLFWYLKKYLDFSFMEQFYF